MANITSDDLKNDATMRDVVARCEEGIAAQMTAHNKQMARMMTSLESMQDMLNVMEAARNKQQDALAKRDAHIDKLEQELSNAKASMMIRPSKVPANGSGPAPSTLPTSTSSTTTSATKKQASNPRKTMTPSVPHPDMLTPAIQLATQKITAAISSGLQLDTNGNLDDDDYDMLTSSSTSTDLLSNTGISTAIHSVIRKVLSFPLHTNNNNNMNQDIDCDTSAITNAIQNAVKNAAATEAVAPRCENIAEFTPIEEAVSFVRSSTSSSFIMESAVFIDEPNNRAVEEDDLPQLVVQGDDCPSAMSETDDTDTITDDEFSSVEELVEHIWEKRELLPSKKTSAKASSAPYEPYAASIRQPSVLPILFNRWTLFAAIVFVLSQYS